MKNIYSILILSLVLSTVALFGQTKIYTPKLRAPESQSVNQMPNVILDWDAVTGTTPDVQYELYLDFNPDFTDPVIFDKTDVTAKKMDDLLFGGTYYWKVRAWEGEEVSDWSEVWSFSVLWTVQLDKPNDGTEVYANPNISWDSLGGVDGYQMQVDTAYAWSHENSGVDVDLNGTAVMDDQMWVVGAEGIILNYQSGSWVTVESGIATDLNDICFISADNAYAVGDDGAILNYNGTTWTSVDDPSITVNINAVDFIDANNGVLVGEGGMVAIYSSGTWNVASTGDDKNLNDVDMLSTSSIWACGESSVVVNYDGSEWFVNEIGSKDYFAIDMISDIEGWVAGKDIYRYNGVLWYEEESNTTKQINGLSMSGANSYAVADDGVILLYTGSWDVVTSGVDEDLLGVDMSSDNGLIVGTSGTIIQKVDEGFNSSFLENIAIPADSNNWDLSNLLFGQTFYYRIRAYHGTDTSNWSGVKTITTYPTVYLDTPEDGEIVDLEVDCKWSEYNGVTNYLLQVSSDEAFTNPNTYNEQSYTATIINPAFGRTGYWRVAAQHAEDISEWSEVRSFNVINTVALASPENGATDIASCPLLQWEYIYGASGYEIWVDTDPSFPEPSVSTSDTSVLQCATPYEKGTTYYWKVRGKSGSSQTLWSDTWDFTTEGAIGIVEVFNSDAVNIYPNPSDGEFNIYLNSVANEDYSVKVIDISGRIICEFNIACQSGSNHITYTLNNAESGTYNVVISNGTDIVTKRLILN